MRIAFVCAFVSLFVGFEAGAKKPPSKKTNDILVDNIVVEGQPCRIAASTLAQGMYTLECKVENLWVNRMEKAVSSLGDKEWLVVETPPADSPAMLRAWVVLPNKKVESLQCVYDDTAEGWRVRRGSTPDNVTIQRQQEELVCNGRSLVFRSRTEPPKPKPFAEQPDAQ